MGIFDTDYPAVKFERIGDSFTGKITEPYTVRDATEFGTNRPKLDSRGQVVQMAVINVEDVNTHETMTIFADKFPLRKAIGESYRAAGASDLEVGGILTVTFTHETPSDKGNPSKGFSAKYVRPSAATNAGLFATTQADAVGAARATQQAVQAAHQPPSAPTQAQPPAPTATAPQGANGGSKIEDMRKIKALGEFGLSAADIEKQMDGRYTINAIQAVLSMP